MAAVQTLNFKLIKNYPLLGLATLTACSKNLEMFILNLDK